MTSPAFSHVWDAKTDTGAVRPHNEDCWTVEPERGLFVVCDGIGGARPWRSRILDGVRDHPQLGRRAASVAPLAYRPRSAGRGHPGGEPPCLSPRHWPASAGYDRCGDARPATNLSSPMSATVGSTVSVAGRCFSSRGITRWPTSSSTGIASCPKRLRTSPSATSSPAQWARPRRQCRGPTGVRPAWGRLPRRFRWS